MEKVLCCPNCKSEDLKISENDKNIAICRNCENAFYTLEYYEKKFKKLERVFGVISGVSIMLLVVGVVLFIFNLYMSESVKDNSFIKIMESIGLGEAACFVYGIVFLVIALILVYILFMIRRMISKVARSRHFMRNRGQKDKV